MIARLRALIEWLLCLCVILTAVALMPLACALYLSWCVWAELSRRKT